MISFRNIAASMNPQTCAEAKLDPLPSLRELIARHRWQSNADTPNSLHDLALRRHTHSTEIRFLFYNTFLLDGFNFDFCNTEVIEAICRLVGIEPMTFLGGITLPVGTLVDLFGIGEDVLDALGIGIDDLASKYPEVVAAAVIAPWTVLTVGTFIAAKGLLNILEDFNVGIFELMKAAGLNPYEVIGKLCDIGNSSVIVGIPGLLADFLGVGLNDLLAKVTLKNKPEIYERSWEIGTRVASKYDIAALCEIFSPEVFERLTQAVSTTGEFQAFSGPDVAGGAAYLSSGLLALVQKKFKVIGTERLIFQNRGKLF